MQAVAHMLQAIKHMFSEVKPFDWLMLCVEVAVLLLIAGEAIFAWLHRRHKRAATIRTNALLAEGQLLADSVPKILAGDDCANAWIDQVKDWIKRAQSFLASDAKEAVVVFNQKTLGPYYVMMEVSPQALNWSHDLDSRLKSLRSIMEKPDIYF